MPGGPFYEELEKIPNLEMVNWVAEDDSLRAHFRENGTPIERWYETYDEARAAILRDGPIIVATRKFDLLVQVLGGRFDDEIMAIRTSGRNVRRFLIREKFFAERFGTFENLMNQLISNRMVDCEIEETHLRDYFKELELDKVDFETHDFDRLEIDLVAANQLLDLKDAMTGGDEGLEYLFATGFSVGRLFSGIQNMVTLEHDARKSHEYEESYRERGRKGKSSERRQARIEHLLCSLEALVSSNPDMSSMPPKQVAQLAVEKAAEESPELWSQGKNQLDQYLTELASDPEYKHRYYSLFDQTG